MKYWRGYLTAAIFAGLTLAVQQFAKNYTTLLDMVYPYMTRMIQNLLGAWSSGFDFCLWQVLLGVAGVLLIASVVVMVALKWNFFQWLGWVLAFVSIGFCLHTGIYGLNTYCGSLSEDIRMNVTEFTITELVGATTYYRDKANELSSQVPRDEEGNLQLPAFDQLAQQAGDGFRTLTHERSYSVFGGETFPVKQLGMAELLSSMGIHSYTAAITGESAVDPRISGVALPYTMCYEMAHRMSIAREQDANLAAFLACQANSDPVFQYAAYLSAYHYCFNILSGDSTSTAQNAAQKILSEVSPQAQKDLQALEGDSDQEVCVLLVSWYIQEVYLPTHQDEVEKFNPLDPEQVELDYTVGG